MSKYIDSKTKEELSIINMYDLVFEDIVKCYIEDNNYVGNEENFIELTEREIKRIAYKMICKNEYIWEIINETIDMYIGEILLEREKNNE